MKYINIELFDDVCNRCQFNVEGRCILIEGDDDFISLEKCPLYVPVKIVHNKDVVYYSASDGKPADEIDKERLKDYVITEHYPDQNFPFNNRVVCPHCGGEFNVTVDDYSSYKVFKCPHCGEEVKVEFSVYVEANVTPNK